MIRPRHGDSDKRRTRARVCHCNVAMGGCHSGRIMVRRVRSVKVADKFVLPQSVWRERILAGVVGITGATPPVAGVAVAKLLLSLVPASLRVLRIVPGPDRPVVITDQISSPSICPSCQWLSRRHHGAYEHIFAALPCQGRPVQLQLRVRRFFWSNLGCRR